MSSAPDIRPVGVRLCRPRKALRWRRPALCSFDHSLHVFRARTSRTHTEGKFAFLDFTSVMTTVEPENQESAIGVFVFNCPSQAWNIVPFFRDEPARVNGFLGVR